MSVDASLLLLTCFCHSFLFLVHTHISVFELYNVYSSTVYVCWSTSLLYPSVEAALDVYAHN